MLRRPPRSTLFPTRRSSDLLAGFGYSPLWSRDGSQILVVRNAPQRGAEAVIPHVFLLDPTDGAPTRILEAELGKRSEEHTSELQSRLHLVCRLLLEKKKKNE